jgi:hypothetical protein
MELVGLDAGDQVAAHGIPKRVCGPPGRVKVGQSRGDIADLRKDEHHVGEGGVSERKQRDLRLGDAVVQHHELDGQADAEQARILRLLIERIDVAPDGNSVTLHAAGIRSLVAELADRGAPALAASEPVLEAAE